MSKLSESLRGIKVCNNHSMLVEFGGENDLCVEYYAPPSGRIGWGGAQHTAVWSPLKPHPVLPLYKWPHATSRLDFFGPRSKSLPAARAWVAENTAVELVPSPFGGYLPKGVVARAKVAIAKAQAAS